METPSRIDVTAESISDLSWGSTLPSLFDLASVACSSFNEKEPDFDVVLPASPEFPSLSSYKLLTEIVPAPAPESKQSESEVHVYGDDGSAITLEKRKLLRQQKEKKVVQTNNRRARCVSYQHNSRAR